MVPFVLRVTQTWLPVTNLGEENCDSLTCTNQQSTNNRNDLFPYFPLSLSLSVSSSISLANNNMISAALRQFCHHTFRVYCLLLARWLKYDTSHISIRHSHIMCCILGSEGDLLLLGDEYV